MCLVDGLGIGVWVFFFMYNGDRLCCVRDFE